MLPTCNNKHAATERTNIKNKCPKKGPGEGAHEIRGTVHSCPGKVLKCPEFPLGVGVYIHPTPLLGQTSPSEHNLA
jgi:hypothetical protein